MVAVAVAAAAAAGEKLANSISRQFHPLFYYFKDTVEKMSGH